jgi:hypothetical protein
MAELNSKPGSSTAKQHQALAIAGKGRGLSLAEIRKAVGGSLRKLSAAEASRWIEHFSGQGLPNPPGQKPSAYKGKRPAPGTVRMMTEDQIDQIMRLGVDYFAEVHLLIAWLVKDFKVPDLAARGARGHRAIVRQLGTAKRAGQVIRVLKLMIARRNRAISLVRMMNVAPASVAPASRR